jgi:hypothetical protein
MIKLHPADGIWRSPPLLEGSFLDNDPGAGPIENLGIRRQYYERVRFGAGYPTPMMHLWT